MKKIISKLKSKSLFVYGTGKAAVSFHELAKSNDFEIDGFIETKPKRKSFLDLPLFSLEEFEAKKDCLIVVASMFYREIEREISKKISVLKSYFISITYKTMPALYLAMNKLMRFKKLKAS